MHASDLIEGQTFVEVDPETWDEMSPREQHREKRVTMLSRHAEQCTAHRERVHLRTSAGQWCITAITPVTVIAQQATAAQKRSA